MKNRELFLKDPQDVQLLNNGVAKVMDTRTEEVEATANRVSTCWSIVNMVNLIV